MSDLLKTPKSIKETVVAEPPQEGYEAYLYIYTNLDNGKMYVGIHKGDYNDGYTNSSTNEEFNEALANPNSNFRYEVKEYGTYPLMTVRENDILVTGRGEDKDLYYNKTNGSPQFRIPDFDAVDYLIKQVKKGHYPITQMARENLEKLSFLQVRTEEYPDLKKDIAQSIDEAAGDTSLCEPIVIFEGRGSNKEDIGGDGNHTHGGGMASKKMTAMPVMKIPFKDNKNYSMIELRTFANEMNAPQEVHKNPASKDDLKKQLLGMIVDAQDKSVLDDPSVKKWLVDKMHVTKAKASGLIKSAKAQYDKDKGVEADKYFRTYGDAEWAKWIRKYELGNPEGIIIPIPNSNFVKYDQIMRDLEINLKRDRKGVLLEPIQPEKRLVTFLVRHKSSTHVDRWDDTLSKNLKTTVYPYLKLLGVKPTIVVLPFQVIDNSILKFTNEAA